jgi:hypothetical protein
VTRFGKFDDYLRELEIGASDFSGAWCLVFRSWATRRGHHEIVEMLKQHDTQ